MAAQARPVLGVEIRQDAIRVVEMSGVWPAASVHNVASVELPPGTIDKGHIVSPEVVAQTLRNLLERTGISARDTVLAMAEQNVITRVIEVPQAPDNELPMVIEGELAHYKMLGAQAATLDFMRMPEEADKPRAVPQVLVVAAEEALIKEYCQVADLAGLRLLALEPGLFAMYRAAFLQLDRHPTAISIAIGATEAEIAIVERGQIRLYRRVDVGSVHLLAGRKSLNFEADAGPTPFSHIFFEMGEDEPAGDAEPARAAKSQLLDLDSVSSLAMELRRSLEYYYSQNPRATAVEHAVVAVQAPEMESLAEWLSQMLRMEVSVARLPVSWASSQEAANRLTPPNDLSFLTACGLAMRELTGAPASLPAFDLSTRQRGALRVQYSRRHLTLSLAASILILLVGIGSAISIGLHANALNHEAGHATEDLTRLQHIKKARLDARETQTNLMQALHSEGFPIPRILDAIGCSIAPHSALVDISISQDGRVSMTGEAVDEKAMIATLEGLKSSPYLENTVLDSFGKPLDAKGEGSLERFQVTSQLVGTLKTVQKAP